MTVRTEPGDRWVRAFVGDTAVVDSREPVLFYEQSFPLPVYAFRKQDVRTDLLHESSDEPVRETFSIFLPKGPVAQWYDLEVDGRTIRHAVWARDTPELADLLIFSWEPGVLDRWLEEEEEVASHPRDPHKRVDALPSSRHVVVSLNGVTLADTTDPVLLFETGLPTRYYLPRESVNFDALTPSENSSHCPYKGVADQYWDIAGAPDGHNAVWSYSDPTPAVGRIKDRIAFYNEIVDIRVDDVDQQRPESVFSARKHRPGS